MESTVNSSLLNGFAGLVADCGGDMDAISRQSGIPMSAFSEWGLQVPARQVLVGFELAAHLCGYRYFGLALAERSTLAVVQPLWPLLHSAETVRQLLEDLAGNFHAFSDRAYVSLVEVDSGAMLQFDIMAGECESQVQIAEFALPLAFREICEQVGRCHEAATFLFRHSRPSDLSAHHRILGPNISFDFDCNAIFLEADLLESPCSIQDEHDRAEARQGVDDLLRASPLDMARRVETAIRACPNLSDCSVKWVSRHLGKPTRTVQRALAAEGCSFRRVMDDVRADLARKYLAQSLLDIRQVAELLGYAEISAFSRAYRRWHGATPSNDRRNTRAA